MKKRRTSETGSIAARLCFFILLTAGATALAVIDGWLWALAFAPLIAKCLYDCIDLYRRQMRKVILLIDALENSDNTIRFAETERDDGAINHELNRVAHVLHEAKAETIEQEQYYELILNVISAGVVVLNDCGAVYQKNHEALRLMGLEVFTHVSQLSRIDTGLAERLQQAAPGDAFRVTVNNERGRMNLMVRVSGITIRGEQLRIIAMNDINRELDEKEIDAWTRLIRVLTHEIMNAVTPITSLSDTLITMAKDYDEGMKLGLQTISNTGKGLMKFVESYRKLAYIPAPKPEQVNVRALIDRMVVLTRHQCDCRHITFDIRVAPDNLIVHADWDLTAQVLINLMKNAVEAIGDKPGGLIRIRACSTPTEAVQIDISNNGEPLSADIAEQIFVPFFTTKPGGSGIGLSLSRQIMQRAGGSLTLQPVKRGAMTTFTLRFN